MSEPTAPAGYTWEATNEAVAARYGVPVERIVRFDLNTSPAPPDLAARLLAQGTFEAPLSEYGPSDYRRLIAAAAARYGVTPDRLIVGAGADEILDIVTKTFLPPGGRVVLPTPTYAMYRVLSEQRGATVVAVPRLGPDHGWALDRPAIRAEARGARLVWLCSPNNPTALAEPDGTIEALLDEITADAARDGTAAPIVVLDEAYAEFVGHSLASLVARSPSLVVVRTVSKAYALAGLRVGFGLADPSTIARMEPYRPPQSIATTSVTIATEALLDPDVLRENLARVAVERERLAAGLTAAGWSVGPSVTNFLLADLGSPVRASATAEWLLQHGLVPRTFPADHPLAASLRITVRAAEENERLIDAARAMHAAARP